MRPQEDKIAAVRRQTHALGALAVTAALASAGCGIAHQTFVARTPAMAPAIRKNSSFSVDSSQRVPRVGTIILFHPPAGAPSQACAGGGGAQLCDVVGATAARKLTVKRVVGLPGDSIAIAGGRVIRNGRPEREPSVARCSGAAGCTFRRPITVPQGAYYVLGDNLPSSYDSRFFGPIRAGWIVGTVTTSP